MLYDSAMPEKVKRTTLSQEVISILRNCHPNLPWQSKQQHQEGRNPTVTTPIFSGVASPLPSELFCRCVVNLNTTQGEKRKKIL